MRAWMWSVVLASAAMMAEAQGSRGERPTSEGTSEERVVEAGCQHRDRITRTANYILSERRGLGIFPSARYGTDAAYFLLHYSGADDGAAGAAAVFEFAKSGTRRPPRGLDALEAAYWITWLGLDEAAARLDRTPAALIIGGDLGVIRASLLFDGGFRFFELLEEIRDDADLNAQLKERLVLLNRPVLATLDQPDEIREIFGLRALEAGEADLGLQWLATLPDLEPYYDVLEDAEDVVFGAPKFVTQSGFTLEHQARPMALPDGSGAAAQPGLYQVMRAAYFGRSADFLTIMLNQSGEAEAMTYAASVYLEALAEGRVGPAHDIEAAWRVVHNAMVLQMGADRVAGLMSGFDTRAGGRHFAGRGQSVMDWVQAKHVIRGYVRGEVDFVPARPAVVSEAFPWDRWVALAAEVRAGATGFGAEDAPMALELYALREDFDTALQVAEAALP
ncbi:MAG: hypothetical protein AAGP08_08625, partial [Pseudomonadota bacterium]